MYLIFYIGARVGVFKQQLNVRVNKKRRLVAPDEEILKALDWKIGDTVSVH